MTWWWLMLFIIVVFLIAMIWIDSNGVAPPVTANPECPHDQSHELALPGKTTNIPEFHDCQRLINKDSTTYGALAGIFARDDLASTPIKTVSGVAAMPASEGGLGMLNPSGGVGGAIPTATEQSLRASAVAIAEIESYDLPYDPLGIARNFNCLYIVRVQPTGGGPYYYLGLMIQKGSDDTGCRDVGAPRDVPGKWLTVKHTPKLPNEPPFLAVARWDWDAASRKQYISIFCDKDWCEVGDFDLTPVPARSVALTSAREKAVWEQKGRYDEQRLAITPQGGATLVPSDVRATAVPDPNLERYALSDFDNFVPVAKTVLPAAMHVYKRKYNFGPGNIPGTTNEVSLCSGWRFNCLPLLTAISTMFTLRCWKSAQGKIWWARIKSSDGSVEYRCVTRRVHPGVIPPAAARWRWKMQDEGLWVRCEAGCCEVQET